ncbi:shikimate dehydrogenase [Rhizobium tibeticum]|jgi:shikimate dehydrogenase|uniref:Shikimate dehydrogenase (NADP(+)) n=1 Tax=Rhizobium tibeticum TaxID=501024 RepID=A0A1H8VLI9_9HYPH|nr:shikimate dehydrogenase [Rhizobium tibeticum]SEI11144.1 Quinate/shikimate dehydrogenase [Rhizobium tibeticum]SEP16154.1 shikimate dehydrogenase [Rhizobium tibeticum]
MTVSNETMKRPVLVGLIGADIQMSKSPALHQREGALQGLDYRYELLDLAERGLPPTALPNLLAEEEARGFAGSNITHPCKQTVIEYLTDLSDDARMLGAVNTVVFENGRRTGHNTDWYGFYENFQRGLPDVPRHRAVLLGAGGAGVAVAHAAMKLGIERLSIFDQDVSRAGRLAEDLNSRFSAERAFSITDVGEAMRTADGLIHATPTGMKNHPGLPIEESWLEPRHWVADIVYMPLVTELLALATRFGCRTLPGGGMTVFQAAAAFKLFSGIEPDAERMSTHFTELCNAS